MDFEMLKKYISEAQGKEKKDLSSENPFCEIGFDGEKKRLGWVRNLDASQIENAFKPVLPIVDKMETFIFIGMGGRMFDVLLLP